MSYWVEVRTGPGPREGWDSGFATWEAARTYYQGCCRSLPEAEVTLRHADQPTGVLDWEPGGIIARRWV